MAPLITKEAVDKIYSHFYLGKEETKSFLAKSTFSGSNPGHGHYTGQQQG